MWVSPPREAISKAKDELIDWETYQEQAQDYFPKTIARIYQAYQESLLKSNALDFDDLIMLTVKLLEKRPEVLEKCQKRWQYILVDEYQDINTAQYILTNLLSKKHGNLFAIGDDAQAIYSWRGADFRNILNFERDHPKAKIILLEQNYRSTPNILEASHHIISKNTQKKEKGLWTKNPPGSLINVVETENEEEEGQFLVEEIESLVRKGHQLKDFTVLYRTNAQSRAVEEACLKSNFPYKLVGTVRFYERKEVKDILAYLKYIFNPNDLVSCKRIINLPPRGIGKVTFQKQSGPQFENFHRLIDGLRKENQKKNLTQLIKSVIERIDYEKYIKREESASSANRREERWENIQELFSVAQKYNRGKPGQGLEKFLEEIALMSDTDEIETDKNLVNLMTLHCAKGLEFPVVFIVGLEEGIFPHSKSFLDPNQMEEERRLMYVGLTRAKQKAYLTFTRRRRLWGQIMANPPSRFIADIPRNLVEYQEY
ncbi:UvrD-helicase domain-containing protein [Patescibacteria group bacterium]|nr:UvrD-helicase domain-containing protein [Patescibacteria group bacterium]